MKFNNKPNEKVILPDGREIYLSRSVAVIGVFLIKVNDETYVLIEKRGKDLDQPEKWCVPCGYLDWNETADEAIRRETFEEVGLNITKLEGYCISNNLFGPWRINTNPKENRQNVVLHFGCYYDHIEEFPALTFDNNEILDAKWVNIKDLNKYEFAFNHNKSIMSYYQHAMLDK